MIVVADSGPLHYLILVNQSELLRTLGVLRTAAEKELIDIPTVIADLKSTNFYLDDRLLAVFAEWL